MKNKKFLIIFLILLALGLFTFRVYEVNKNAPSGVKIESFKEGQDINLDDYIININFLKREGALSKEYSSPGSPVVEDRFYYRIKVKNISDEIQGLDRILLGLYSSFDDIYDEGLIEMDPEIQGYELLEEEIGPGEEKELEFFLAKNVDVKSKEEAKLPIYKKLDLIIDQDLYKNQIIDVGKRENLIYIKSIEIDFKK